MKFIRTKQSDILGIVALLGIGLLFFYKTIVSGLLPVPSDSLVGLYHPWRDLYQTEYPRGVPFKNFLTTDPVRQQIPWRHTSVEELKSGILPLWSPYSFSGAPLAANIQSGSWNPLNFLFLIFPFSLSWTILIICQPVLAMIFMFLFLRHLKIPVLSSVFGSIIWGFSGFSIAWLTWGTIGHVALWLPLLLYITDCIVNEKRLQKLIIWLLLFVVINFVSLSGGHAQTSLYVIGLAGVYGVWRLFHDARKLSVMSFIISWLVSLVVTLPIWKPMLGVIQSSNRIVQINWLKEGWFFPWQHVAQFIAPDYFGNPTTMNYWGVWNYGEMVGYVGIVGIMFSLGIICIKKTKDEFFWVIILGMVSLLITPNPISELIFRYNVPIIANLQPTRLLVLVDFALSMLATYGFMRLEKGERKPFIWGALGIGLSIVILWVFALMTKTTVSIRNLYLPTGLFVFFTIFISALIRLNKNKKVFYTLIVCVIGISIVDVFRFGWKFTPFTEQRFFFPETETIKFLKTQQGPFRVLAVDDRIFAPNTLEYYGIESVSGYDPLFQKKYAQFVGSLEQQKEVEDIPFERIIAPNFISDSLLSLLNVKYIISFEELHKTQLKLVFEEGQTKVYENTKFLPRVYFSDIVINVKDEKTALSYVSNPTFSPSTESVVMGYEVPKQQGVTQTESNQIIEYKYGNLTIKTDTMRERLLIISNPYYSGWKAYIDGVETNIIPTNYLFMGIIVPGGEHIVQILYR